MGAAGSDVEAVRARVALGHAAVAEGRYDEAVAIFAGALPELTALLGSDHPEVAELADDLKAAREMGEVSAWGRQMGFRHFTCFAPPDRDEG